MTDKIAASLWADIHFAKSSPIRLLHVLLESFQWSPRAQAGLHILRGTLDTLPDNPIVEDAHKDVRRDVKTSVNLRRSARRIQDVLECSSALERRDISHPSKYNKDTFLAEYHSARTKTKNTYVSTKRKLPEEFAEASWLPV